MRLFCRLCLSILSLAALAAGTHSQDPGLEVQSSQGLADEEVSHWGAALALLALQVGFLRSEHDACITK